MLLKEATQILSGSSLISGPLGLLPTSEYLEKKRAFEKRIAYAAYGSGWAQLLVLACVLNINESNCNISPFLFGKIHVVQTVGQRIFFQGLVTSSRVSRAPG